MYKTVKTQTNLPVKICHLKVAADYIGVWRRLVTYSTASDVCCMSGMYMICSVGNCIVHA